MRNFLKDAYLKYSWIRSLINPMLKFRNLILPEKFRLKKRFKRRLGYSLNLKNPTTFNEKIQWLKINNRTTLHPICADKYTVRNYIKEVIGEEYLIPLVFSSENLNDVQPEVLPNFPFILKTNHDSSGGEFVWDKSKVDWDKLRNSLSNRLNLNYSIFGKGEWQYASIKPMILGERLLITEEGDIPADFKMHCFNGKLKFTQVDSDRQTNHTRNLYDKDWNLMPVRWLYKNGGLTEKPIVYEKMISIAETIAQKFVYIRVDLYVVRSKIYFGELTFHSDSGNGKFIPKEWDAKFGQMLELTELGLN
ncbi:ATP-grasp fold amidoligase family protein [Aurantibacter sp.]|uniref:ATP-grasp fold amidoligase family protein n=1 Tax=Aurantibacter sp. TaxID=2807103 RepID=UPI00326502C1